MGKKWDYDVPSIEVWKECLRVLKPGGTALIFAGSRTQHRMAVNVEDAGFILKDCIMWLYGSGFPKATDISKQLDKKNGTYIKGEVSPNSRNSGESPSGCYGEGVQNKTLPNPQSEEAKLWNGWKSHGLKPAYEPILVAMKPNDGTYAQNALKHGVSGLNIEQARIKTDDNLGRPIGCGTKEDKIYGKYNAKAGTRYGDELTGRFPANIILDEEVAKDEDWKRYFYCAKASKSERNKGCEELEEKVQKTTGKGIDSTVRRCPEHNECIPSGYQTYRCGCKIQHHKQDFDRPKKNHHPTVKPLKLMEYLCTLTKTPTGGVVLDPFMGSGTTGLACKNTGRDFIGIEKDEEYYKIAQARLK